MEKSLKSLKTKDYFDGIRNRDRVILSKAITLIESRNPQHKEDANQLLEGLLPFTGNSIRIGITGVPGVGKSTFIEKFGLFLVDQGKNLAVLSIDPTSSRSRGSILGDKTRMPGLSTHKNAYVRPSPSGSRLGGIAEKTREVMLLCEAAGYEIIIVETVGVGQSETAVKQMVDFFLLLMLSGGGDELQGIKRGIMEMADAVAINKVDGDNIKAGKMAARACEMALHLFPPPPNGWNIPVSTISAQENTGLEEIWQNICSFVDLTRKNGFFHENRERQNLDWFRDALRNKLEEDFYQKPAVKERIAETEKKIASGELTIRKAMNLLLHK